MSESKMIEAIAQAIQVVDKLKESLQSFAADCAIVSDGLSEAEKWLETDRGKVEKLESRLSGLKRLLLDEEKENGS